MRALFGLFFLCVLGSSALVQAQDAISTTQPLAPALTEISVAGDANPADLRCPHEAAAPSKRPAPAARRTPVVDAQDWATLLAYSPPAGAAHLSLPAHLRPQRQPGTAAAVAFWGDSHVAARFFSDGLWAALGWQAADIAPSFIPPTMSRAGVRLPLRKFCVSRQWRVQTAAALQKAGQVAGPALAALENTGADASLALDFRRDAAGTAAAPALRSLDIALRVQGSSPSSLELQVDSDSPQTISLAPGAQRIRLQGSAGFSQLRLRVLSGQLQIDGYLPSYVQAPGLLVDVLGIPGAVAKSWQASQAQLWWQLPRTYDLLLLEYGTNEGADPHFSADHYRSSLRQTLQGMRRAYPQTPCLLIGPTDRGAWPQSGQTRLGLDTALRYSQVHAQIAAVQRELAAEFSCGFWNWQAAMGGMGSAYHWYAASPRLMAPDLIHLSVQGYKRSAQSLAADMQLASWLAP